MTQRYHPLAACETCPLRDQETYVPTDYGDGPLAVVGEAPGFNEVRLGVPFVGRSGDLLASYLLRSTKRVEAFTDATITNAVACMPPLDHQDKPTVPAAAITACAARLTDDLKHAKKILALGRTAAKAVTGKALSINDSPHVSRDVRHPDRVVVVAPHPAAVLRNAAYGERLEAGLNLLNSDRIEVVWEWAPYEVATSADDALRKLDTLWGSPLVVDVETVGGAKWDRFHVDRLRMVGLGGSNGTLILTEETLNSEAVKWALSHGVLNSRGVVGHMVKYDLGVLRRRGIDGRLAGDTYLASAVFDERPGGRGLGEQAGRHLGVPDWKPKRAASTRWYAEAPDEELAAYLSKDVQATVALMAYHQAKGSWDHPLYRDLLVPADTMLLNVEDRGMGVDEARVQHALKVYEAAEEKARGEVERWFECNPNAPHQLRDAFSEAGVVLSDTSKETLRDLREKPGTHPLVVNAIDSLLYWRKLATALRTYVRPLAHRQTSDGRIHSELNPIGAETGRLTSKAPNSQNFPRPATIAEGFPDVRQCIYAGPGRVFVKADLEQAELRAIAVESGDPELLEVCRSGDLHAEVAARIGRPRVQAKTVNFGLPFGITAEGIAYNLGIPLSDARQLLEDYYERFPRVREWQEGIRRKAHEGEWLTTIFGRTRRPPDLAFLDPRQREGVEREMLAFKSQAIVSDITLKGAIAAEKSGVQVVNLVHDEIRAECDEADAEEVALVIQAGVREAALIYTQMVDFPCEVSKSTHWV